ncbi:hypothetical protein [Streptomyces sp. NBC_00401]|uniref:hypothetical protein n=1 Tax=unclassified Streptomyces TaxID=2593676 RepID=UPI00224FF3D3|nr:hypothetical protein [Streptomyces sp. NBC_00401]MCX5084049.1 hypothetical protein [Streptomyces sp. NBC_00401]
MLSERLRSANQLDRSRAVIDSSHVRAARRGHELPSPAGRSRLGTNQGLFVRDAPHLTR